MLRPRATSRVLIMITQLMMAAQGMPSFPLPGGASFFWQKALLPAHCQDFNAIRENWLL
jgi:hypothetical protein